MTPLLWFLSIASGLIAGTGSYVLFLRMPERWMRDESLDADGRAPLPEPRLALLPYGLLWILLCTVLSIQAYSAYGATPVAALCVLALVPLSIMFASDSMTRIIPDQGVVALAVLGALLWCVDRIPSWSGISPGSSGLGSVWYMDMLNRLGGAVAGGLLLLLVGWIGSRLAGVEAMGMGDVKLLAAAGLVSGLTGLIAVLLVGFTTGAVFAIPALVRKYRRRPVVPEGGDPGEFPDGTMPFGPFLVVGTLSVLFFQDFLIRIADWYLSSF